MTKILYLHGFASSADSTKANQISSFINKEMKKTKILIPDLNNNIKHAHDQIKFIIKQECPTAFMGSSLGGFYGTYFSEKYNLPEKFILNVGTIEERKNLLTILKSIKELPKQHLVVIGNGKEYKNKWGFAYKGDSPFSVEFVDAKIKQYKGIVSVIYDTNKYFSPSIQKDEAEELRDEVFEICLG